MRWARQARVSNLRSATWASSGDPEPAGAEERQTSAMKRDLIEALTHAQMDDPVRVIVFIGSGDSFSPPGTT